MTRTNLSWRRWLNNLAQLAREYVRPSRGKLGRRSRSRLVLESLEDRIAPVASMLKDIGTALGTLNPQSMTAVGNTLYFPAGDSANSGLGKWDGNNFTLIRIGHAPTVSTPYDMTAAGNSLYFVAYDGSGDQLFKYDGNNLSEIKVGTINNPAPNSLRVVGSNLYFSASDGTGNQLWKYDGSKLSEIKVGTASNPAPYGLKAVGSNLYFGANDGSGNQLWKYDGSNLSEVKVGTSTNPGPTYLTAVGSNLYFNANDGSGKQLWKYDGSNLSEIKVGTYASPNPIYLTTAGSTLYFTASDGSSVQLWKYDGSSLSEIPIGTSSTPDATQLTAVGNNLYFSASDGTGTQLWKYDGSNLSEVKVGPSTNPGPSYLKAVGSTLYFSAFDGTSIQLWKYDGSNLSEIQVGTYAHPNPSEMTAVGSIVYFLASNSAGPQLWSYDPSSGTVQQEVMYTTLASSSPSDFMQMGQKVYFFATEGSSDDELWATDGTASGTTRLSDLNLTTNSSESHDMTVAGSTLYFMAWDGTGRQLWKYDGSNLSEIKVGTQSDADPQDLTAVGSTLYFRAVDGSGSWQLWKYDGSNLTEIKVGTDSSPYPQDLTVVGSTLYFVAIDGTSGGVELWKYDGSNLSEIKVGTYPDSYASDLTAFGGNLYFNAYDGTNYQLWKYDGSNLTEITVGTYSSPSPDHLTVAGSDLYFRAYNGTQYQVWKYDGSSLTNIAYLNPTEMAAVGSTLYANDGSSGELWKYDGSNLSEIKVGTYSSPDPAHLTAAGSNLYFVAYDGTNNQLWEYDGYNVTEITINPNGASLANGLYAAGNTLYLSANDEIHGDEPWIVSQPVAAYNFAQGSGSTLTDISGNGNNGTISNASWTTVNNSSLPFTGALQFSGGNNSFVTIANSASLDLTTGMTLEAWVDPTAAAKNWQDVMYKYHDNYYLEASSPSGAPAAGGTAGSSDTGPYGNTPLPTNTWSFLAASYDGTNMILYVNGVQVASLPVSGNLATSTAALQIGGDSIYGQYFQGLISNVRIYNLALSQSAIQTDMYTAIGSPAGTQPTVTSVTPANNQTGVSTRTAVTVYFSEALAPATVTSSTIQLLNSSGSAVAASVTYDSSTDSATLTPNAALAASSTYTILVHGGSNGPPVIESAAYNPLAANFSSSFTTAASPSGLVAAYNFAQGSGSVLPDLSGNGNNGAISNATWTTVSNSSLPFTGALQFAGGNNSLVTIANSEALDLTTGMTLEAWVDPTAAANGWQDVMYKARDNYYLEASSPSGAPAAGGTAGSTDTGPSAQNPLPVNTWSFLAATYNGTNMILYINGVQVASQAVSGNLATSTNPLQIGGDSIYGQYFQGLISNVRIYSTALTAAELQEDMNTPVAAETPPRAPTNLTATASGPTINLNWKASSSTIGVSYVVEQEAPGSSSFVPIATTTGTSYFDNGLAPNSTYSYKVQAVDWVGNQSAFSNTASATTGAGTAGLMAAYNFAQGSGSVLTDNSGNENNGTISNASWTTVNNSNLPFTGALQFTGDNNSYVTIADSPALELTTGMTLEAWVDPTAAVKGWQDVMYKYHDNYYLEASSPSGAPAAGGTAGSSDTGPYGNTPLPINTWSFLAATYDGTNMILYVNGVQVASVAVSGNLATSTAALQIGGDSIYGQYFQGMISNIRIYNKALSQSAIQTDMNTAIG